MSGKAAMRGDISKGPEFALAVEWMEAALEWVNIEMMFATTFTLVFSLQVEAFGEDNPMTEGIRAKLLEVRKLHDEHFIPPLEGNGPSFHPGEFFFVRKLGSDLNVTCWDLRQEEDRMFREERFTKQDDGFKYSIRDFQHLCRGLKLVTNMTESTQANLYSTTCYCYCRGDPTAMYNWEETACCPTGETHTSSSCPSR
jgi:hypothetical protein